MPDGGAIQRWSAEGKHAFHLVMYLVITRLTIVSTHNAYLCTSLDDDLWLAFVASLLAFRDFGRNGSALEQAQPIDLI